MLQAILGLAELPLVERRTAWLQGREVTYVLKRSDRRRSIGLRIDDEGLTVSLPLRASEKWLHSVLQEKSGWIVAKLDGWRISKPAPVLWQDGETVSFLGESLTLRVTPSLFDAEPLVRGRELHVHVAGRGDEEEVARRVTQWYRREAERLFAERVAHYSALMGVAPSALKLSAARTQWGSCNARGVIHLNWQLVRLPMRLLDYVVVHELAHLVELNHSEAFWAVVASVCPEYRKRRAELRQQHTPDL